MKTDNFLKALTYSLAISMVLVGCSGGSQTGSSGSQFTSPVSRASNPNPPASTNSDTGSTQTGTDTGDNNQSPADTKDPATKAANAAKAAADSAKKMATLATIFAGLGAAAAIIAPFFMAHSLKKHMDEGFGNVMDYQKKIGVVATDTNNVARLNTGLTSQNASLTRQNNRQLGVLNATGDATNNQLAELLKKTGNNTNTQLTELEKQLKQFLQQISHQGTGATAEINPTTSSKNKDENKNGSDATQPEKGSDSKGDSTGPTRTRNVRPPEGSIRPDAL